MEIISEEFLDNRNKWGIYGEPPDWGRYQESVHIENGILHFKNLWIDAMDSLVVPKNLCPDGKNIHVLIELQCILNRSEASCFGLQIYETDKGELINFYVSTSGNHYATNMFDSGGFQPSELSWRIYAPPIITSGGNTLELIVSDKNVSFAINKIIIYKETTSWFSEHHHKIFIIAGQQTELIILSVKSLIGDDFVNASQKRYDYEDGNNCLRNSLDRDAEFEEEEPSIYIKSDGEITTNYDEWKQDYDEGGFMEDDDYFINGKYDE